MPESSIEERWCIRLKDNKACDGPRRRTTSCHPPVARQQPTRR